MSEKYPAMNDLTDMELIILHHKCMEFPDEDEDFRSELLLEIGRRYKAQHSESQDDESCGYRGDLI